jgi:hypothetical protein
MRNKKWLVLLIIAFPSLFWLILESSTINSRKLPYYGRKTILKGADTLYQEVNAEFYKLQKNVSSFPGYEKVKNQRGVFVLAIVQPIYRKDGYRLAGLWEYLNYKKDKIAQIPFVMLCPIPESNDQISADLKAMTVHQNLEFVYWKQQSFDSLAKSYFIEKPYYIDYSFFILIDEKCHIRGYYDMRYAAEMKRLIDEYRHLRLKEEKQKLIQSNEIKSRP